MASDIKIDQEAIRLLANLLKETNLGEIEYQIDSLRIRVSSVGQSPAPAPHGEISGDKTSDPEAISLDNMASHVGVIEAQMVGTVYLSPGPGAEPFISVGDTVSEGQTLFIIEAMKVMNMIKAPRSGVVKHIFVKEAQPVEYGDPIVVIV